MASDTKRPEKIALFSVIISTCYLLFIFLIDHFQAQSSVVQSVYFPLSATFLFSILAFWHFRLVRSVEEESAERERIRMTYERNDLFKTQDELINSALQTRIAVERYFIPGITIISGLLFAFLGYKFHQIWAFSSEISMERDSLSVAGLCMIAFILFLVTGSYLVGVSRAENFRWLRPVGHWLKLSAVLALLSTLVMVAEHLQIGYLNSVPNRVISLGFIYLGLEIILSMIFGFYRSPTKDKTIRPPFESLSLAIAMEPKQIVQNFAFVLDYQFGLKVRDRWLYRVVECVLLPYLLLTMAALYLLDCIVLVNTDEIGIKERFGNSVRNTPFEPGLYLKFPTPIETIRKFPVKRINRINIGFTDNPDVFTDNNLDSLQESNTKLPDKIILWNKRHHHSETKFLVASYNQKLDRQDLDRGTNQHNPKHQPMPVNILAATIPIFYKIDERSLFNYAYSYEQPEKILENTASQAIVKFFSSVDFLDITNNDRLTFKSELENRIRSAIAKLNPPLGIDLQFIGLMGVHPPVEVAESFQKVVASGELKAKKILTAKGYSYQLLNNTGAECSRIVMEAKGYKTHRTMISEGEAKRFQHQQQAYQTAPQVFQTRNLLDLIEHHTKNIKKYIIANHSNEVLIIDLQQKIRPDLLDDLDLPQESNP